MFRNVALAAILVGALVACAPAAPSPTVAPAKPAAPTTAEAKPEAAKPAAPAPAKEQPAKPAGAGLDRARQEAEARGYKFVASHDEIVEKARQEGALRSLASLDKETIKVAKEGFSRQYPFIKFDLQEITGTEAERFVLEIKAGTATEKWDSSHLTPEIYPEYLPYLEKYDLLAMAEQGVLKIPPKMVDPANRNVLAAGTALAAFTYNKKLLAADKAPRAWEDFLKPEFKDKKFVVDIEPSNLASLWPLKGEQWVLDYARKIGAQEPVWARGDTRVLTALGGGEYALHFASNYHSAVRARDKAPDVVEIVVPDPVPVRLAETEGILKGAKNPHAAMLWLEYLASPEGQKLLDDIEPMKSSIYIPGGKVEQAVKGKTVSLLDWKDLQKRGDYVQAITKEWGFPKSEVK